MKDVKDCQGPHCPGLRGYEVSGMTPTLSQPVLCCHRTPQDSWGTEVLLSLTDFRPISRLLLLYLIYLSAPLAGTLTWYKKFTLGMAWKVA